MKAFPTPAFTVSDEARITSIGGEGGMTLRDYFAAKAMQGLVVDGVGSLMDEELADWAYRLADAMLRAREGT
jgi:hypothetical protein